VTRRKDMRDRWYSEVIRTRLVSGSCRELLAYIAVQHMTELGHMKVPRRTLAEALGIAEQRVTVRMSEAVNKGLLQRTAGGVNGQIVQYTALPFWGQGVGSRHPRPGVEVSGERHPQNDTQESASGCRDTAPIRARATYKDREQQPAPAGSRVEREQLRDSTTGTWDEWLPTPSKRPSSDTTGRVA
jgi:DNA-binding Lrp family transcriptional regulator